MAKSDDAQFPGPEGIASIGHASHRGPFPFDIPGHPVTRVSPHQLHAFPFFEGLPEAQLAAIAKASTEKSYEKDAVVLLKGESSRGMFAVAEGTVRIACQSPKGEEKVIDLLGPGRVFGESGMIVDRPYPFMAAATTRARVLHIDGRALLALLDASPLLALRLAANLSRSIVNAVRDIEDLRTLRPHGRLARFLLEERDDKQAPPPPIMLPTTKHVFASRLGMTPESLSRVIRDLAAAGVIENYGRRVNILDSARLATLVG